MFNHLLGLAVLPLYLLVTVLIGALSRRRGASAQSYLNATRSLPLPIVVCAYLAANCGALEIVGLSAMAAQYGVQAFHFYWIGAIPAMVFLALWMMPVYGRSRVQSVPEYLQVRYGRSVRLINAVFLVITMVLLAGISLYAMAQVLKVMTGTSFLLSILLSGSVVLAYVLLGGVRATIYNEVFQLAVILVGLLPLAIKSVGAIKPLPNAPMSYVHLWRGLPFAQASAPMNTVNIVFGLGFVLSFSYWCTDFMLMQRAFAARTEAAARQVPLWAGFGKLLFSFLIVLPGLAAAQRFPQLGAQQRFDQALPSLMKVVYGPVMLGVGLTALAASLMSGLAANVSGFAAVWTEDIYRAWLYPDAPDAHYVKVGRVASILVVTVSIAASYLNFLFKNLMEHVQLIFSIFNAPFWAVFLLGMSTRRTTARGAVAAFLAGTAVAAVHLLAFARGWIESGSAMSSNFRGAIYAFCAALLAGLLASGQRSALPATQNTDLVFRWNTAFEGERKLLMWVLAAVLLTACVVLNLLWL